jgi:hypothetical protein
MLVLRSSVAKVFSWFSMTWRESSFGSEDCLATEIKSYFKPEADFLNKTSPRLFFRKSVSLFWLKPSGVEIAKLEIPKVCLDSLSLSCSVSGELFCCLRCLCLARILLPEKREKIIKSKMIISPAEAPSDLLT